MVFSLIIFNLLVGDACHSYLTLNLLLDFLYLVETKTYDIDLSKGKYLIMFVFCRANAQQPKLFVGMILILIFAEALALYGLIVGIILSSRAGQSRAD